MKIIKCNICNKNIERFNFAINKTNFCSRECYYEFLRLQPKKQNKKEYQCKICDKKIFRWDCDIYSNIFCSRQCWFKYHKRKKYICEGCKKDFLENNHSNRFCSLDCFQKWHRLENATNWQGGKSYEPYGIEFNDNLKEKIRERDNYGCQECGYNQNKLSYKLITHHIDYDKQNNNENNLISLCRNCHSQTNYTREDWENYFKNKMEMICLKN